MCWRDPETISKCMAIGYPIMLMSSPTNSNRNSWSSTKEYYPFQDGGGNIMSIAPGNMRSRENVSTLTTLNICHAGGRISGSAP